MKIGIDIRMISHPGIGRYIRGLMDEFARMKDDHRFFLFGKKDEFKPYRQVVHFSLWQTSLPIYSVAEQLFMPGKINGVNLFHSPHYNAPLLYPGKVILTVHDLIHLLFPEFLPNRLALSYAKFMFSQATKKACRIIAVSENTKVDLVERLEVPAEKIEVIYEGAGEQFQKIKDEDVLEKARAEFRLPARFILYMGSMKNHKNVLTLIKAFKELRHEKDVPEKLVLVGRRDPKAKQIDNFLNSLEAEDDIIYLGELSDESVVYIYNLSSVFVLPSLYEGFGLPVLEAMACGVPVASSDAASLPEVVGDAGILFNPHSVKDMKKAIYKLLSDADLRSELINKGYVRAKQFTWQKAAEKTREIYREAIGR